MTTKTKTKLTKKKSSDIPLDNIPERAGYVKYTPAFKLAAVERYNKRAEGESAEEIARELGISTGSQIAKWARLVANGLPLESRASPVKGKPKAKSEPDVAGGMRAALAQAAHARDERLEVAALIVESDSASKDAPVIAKRIRALKRPA